METDPIDQCVWSTGCQNFGARGELKLEHRNKINNWNTLALKLQFIVRTHKVTPQQQHGDTKKALRYFSKFATFYKLDPVVPTQLKRNTTKSCPFPRFACVGGA